ncbi:MULTISPECIES: SDR family oxidoreductase [Sinorhizobium]|uniref:Nucleoside-diphosphate sugar epimerase n=2 Tax=Sinorhizobium TaxID=28105 RepID=A0A2S3YSH7_9HYPH|nr:MULTISPECIES: SDR family oxidoreductase [Sinorhizobium]AUX80055.1 NAD-dependent nucleoside-diphosphate-sugar epimerase protein [Sinorhizobium fredii]PDT43554.1 nucleoside-diphosphate sugar epimerase [Sinorhizobium sp. FG01]POH34553.1 nucleoside-diphosphate sugar epimerase [Sinorhizobium americanum]
MRVLVIGASGLIGAAVCAKLLERGMTVVRVVRPGSSLSKTGETVELDLARAVRPEDWLPHLLNITAVVNCAGTLQDGPGHDTSGVHIRGPSALFQACEQAGVRRVIHFSAMGVEKQQPSPFSRTKLEGDEALMARDLDWVILRPSVVLGPGAFGASALIRGLAALPVLPIMPNTGLLQVVRLEDVARTVEMLVHPSAPKRLILEIAGPEPLSFEDVVRTYRHWLGWSPARILNIPAPLAGLLYKLSDLAGALGWLPPTRSTAQKEITRGAVGDIRAWSENTGIEPTALSVALARTPITVQERWFARLYLLKPVIFVVLSLFWIATGVISLTTGYQIGIDLMERTGAGVLAGPSVVAGAIADIVIGLAIAVRRTSRAGLYGAIGLSLFYALAGTILLPELWNEPLGPLMKIWPIIVLHLAALAILEER